MGLNNFNFMKHTKIVATLGPASESESEITQMIKAGMNVARLNFSHGSYKHHQMLIDNVRKASKKLGEPIAIMQDLQGPRIRIGEVDERGIRVEKGEVVFLVPDSYSVPIKTSSLYLPIQYPKLYRDVKAGDKVLIDDAIIELKVMDIKKKIIRCKVIMEGVIKSHRGMNFPKVKIRCSTITKKDFKDLEFGIKNDVDFVALSFVTKAGDIRRLRKRIFALERKYNKCMPIKGGRGFDKPGAKGKLLGVHTRIIAKIERPEAVKIFDKILEATDGVMIARGDLGIEMPFEELPLIQKEIIDKCRKAAKPVIVATQMLESMTKKPVPTRAEVSDVANAVLDGTDAIMLSGESATGKYPLKSVLAMARIAEEVEAREIAEQEMGEQKFRSQDSITEVISFVAQDLAEDVTGAKMIVCATTSGFTARNISAFRTKVPVTAIALAYKTVRQLSLSWGVKSYFIPFTKSFNVLSAKIKKLLLREKLAKKGSRIVVVAGHPFGYKGQTNLIKVETV